MPQPNQDLDITANRRASKWSRKALAGRALWAVVQVFFRFSPRLFWGWRRGLLRLFGARIGREVHLHPSVRVTIPWNLDIGDFAAVGDDVRLYNLGLVTIGAKATVSQGAHLCAGTHDYANPALPLVKAPLRVGEGAWICADAFVGPDVTVGDFAIVAARAVAVKDVPAWTIVAGNPARHIRDRKPMEGR
jgi:putative colanic acid biosynthesis acetyltransferase WcaF